MNIMNKKQTDFWLNLSDEIALNVEYTLDKTSDDPELRNITKIGADGTPTHKIDEYAENTAIETIKKTGKSLILISEEIGTIKIGEDDPEVVILMDPIDGTTNAIKKIPCYGISIAIAEIKHGMDLKNITLGDIEIGYVKNFVNEDTYIGIKDHGATKNNQKMELSPINKLSEATLCNYIYRENPAQINKIISSVRRLRLMGAISIELCYIADGTYDVFLDTKAVRLFDIAAAQLILKENNGIVTNTQSQPLSNQLDLMESTSIIATSNSQIHQNIIDILNK